MKKPKRGSSHFTVASLFSGCGGFDLGFIGQGFRPIGAFDIDANVVRVYNENVAPVSRVSDLATETPEISPDVLLAGSPCQGFSTSGKRHVNDPRNELLVRAGKIAVALRPKVFVLENVPAAISGKHGSRWEQVEALLKEAGYTVFRAFIDGSSSGVPQIRKRLFLIAWRGNASLRIELDAVHAPTLESTLSNVEGLSGHDPTFLEPGSREYKIASRIGPGQKLCNVRISQAAVPTWAIPEVFGRVSKKERVVLEAVARLRRRERRRNFGDADPVLPSRVADYLGSTCEAEILRLEAGGYLRRIGHYVDLKHTYNGKFRRVAANGVSPTVDTHFGDPNLFLHPFDHRGFTPREAARIQGFPDSFGIASSRPQAFKMLGNAVPPPMAARLASFIRKAVLVN